MLLHNGMIKIILYCQALLRDYHLLLKRYVISQCLFNNFNWNLTRLIFVLFQLCKVIRYINASPQCWENFADILDANNMLKLVLLLDCYTWWNSTFLMIWCALKLQVGIDTYSQHSVPGALCHFSLNSNKWQQLQYLSDLLALYHEMTLSLSEHQGPTIHKVFEVYETLFNHLEHAAHLLEPKQVDWKVKLRLGVKQAYEKLWSYYSCTYKEEGYIYAIATILNPVAKLQAFITASWIEDGKDWAGTYQEIFIKIFKYYANKNPEINV